MTTTTNMTNKNNTKPLSSSSYPSSLSYSRLIPLHGGYRKLISFQMAQIIYDFTVAFVKKFIPIQSRTKDQMEQAARSGVQNIAEGSQASGTSKKTEIKLTNVARASLEELLLDYEDFLRQRNLSMWEKNSPESTHIRSLSYSSSKSSSSYQSFLSSSEIAANCAICLIHQANYLLDKQIQRLEQDFSEHGGFTERLYSWRKTHPPK